MFCLFLCLFVFSFEAVAVMFLCVRFANRKMSLFVSSELLGNRQVRCFGYLFYYLQIRTGEEQLHHRTLRPLIPWTWHPTLEFLQNLGRPHYTCGTVANPRRTISRREGNTTQSVKAMARQSLGRSPQRLGEDKEQILQDKQGDIERLMDIKEVTAKLIPLGHITQYDMRQILIPSTPKDKAQNFISHLCARGPQAYESVIQILKESDIKDHKDLAKILENCVPTEPPASNAMPDDIVNAKIDKSRHERKMDFKLHDHEKRIQHLENKEQRNARMQVEKYRSLLQDQERELRELKERLERQENNANTSKEENEQLRNQVRSLERNLEETGRTWRRGKQGQKNWDRELMSWSAKHKRKWKNSQNKWKISSQKCQHKDLHGPSMHETGLTTHLSFREAVVETDRRANNLLAEAGVVPASKHD